MTATIAAIVDRVVELVTAITPSLLSSDRFRHTQDEGPGDFRAEAERTPQGAFRRFQVDDDGVDEGLPIISSIDVEERHANINVIVAYPRTHRYGPKNKRARKRVIDEDWRKINLAVGPGYGQANFGVGQTYECTILNCSKAVEEIDGASCDYLVVTIELFYYLDVDAF